MGAVGPDRAGLGSAMTNTSREVGGVLGIAALGTILFSQLSSSIGPLLAGAGLSTPQQGSIVEIARHGVPNPAQLAPLGLSADQAASVQQAFKNAYMIGFHRAVLVAAGVLLVAAIIANRFVPGRATVRDRVVEQPVPVEV
jgi:hypothetical protein